MRIISGKYGGRTLKVPKGLPVRPTTDRTKESLFNILANNLDFEGLRVLDLFSGTGSISLEFLSRGAVRVVSVDAHRGCVMALEQTVRELGCSAESQAIKQDVKKYLEQTRETFDLIFMDPPYEMEGQEALVEAILGGGLLRPDGWLVVEHRSNRNFSRLPGYRETRKYGDSSISFFSPRT